MITFISACASPNSANYLHTHYCNNGDLAGKGHLIPISKYLHPTPCSHPHAATIQQLRKHGTCVQQYRFGQCNLTLPLTSTQRCCNCSSTATGHHCQPQVCVVQWCWPALPKASPFCGLRGVQEVIDGLEVALNSCFLALLVVKLDRFCQVRDLRV